MKKLIIIPAYNESGNIERTVADIKEHASGFDYVVVNDCSRMKRWMYSGRTA
jgi:glycosyltransferase involved in cell wall biosynthesis